MRTLCWNPVGSNGNWQGPCFPRAELWNVLESVVTPVSQVPQQLGWHLAEPSAVVVITGVPRHTGERGGARREEVSVSHWSRHVGLVLTKPTPQWWHLHSSVGEAGFTHYPVFELHNCIISVYGNHGDMIQRCDHSIPPTPLSLV